MSYQGDGSTTSYSVPFPYLKEADVKVTVDGSAVAFSFSSSGIVALQTAPEAGAEIKVYRETDISEVPVDYTDGSVLLEADMDLEVLHNLYVAQEVYDNALDALHASANAVATALTSNGIAVDAQTIAVAVRNEIDIAFAAGGRLYKAIQQSDTALINSQNAVITANQASEDASEALDTANGASVTAGNADLNASEAVSTANTADANASEAKTNAQSALDIVTALQEELPQYVADEVSRQVGAELQTTVEAIVRQAAPEIVEETAASKDYVDGAVGTLDSSLATVAKSGSYNDLVYKPTIPVVPTKVSYFENDAQYATLNSVIPRTGNTVSEPVSGTVFFSTSRAIARHTNTGSLSFAGGSNNTYGSKAGGYVTAYGSEYSDASLAGAVTIDAVNNTGAGVRVAIKPDGTFTHGGKNVITESNIKDYRNIINAKDFGAKGDGVTDDTASIQSAFDSVKGTGGIVFVPTGKYLISSTLYVYGGTILQGEGRSSMSETVDENIGTRFVGTGNPNPLQWTDIGNGQDKNITPMFVACGNGVEFRDIHLEASWTNGVGLFFPSVKQCGFDGVSARWFSEAPVYIDATWSNTNETLKALHPQVTPSSGANEFFGRSFKLIGENTVGIKIQGTTRDPTVTPWIWSPDGASDIVFESGRCSGIWIDASMVNGSANAIQGIRFFGVNPRSNSLPVMIHIDRANRVSFFGCYGEAQGTFDENKGVVSLTSNSGYVNFYDCRFTNAPVKYNDTLVTYDGVNPCSIGYGRSPKIPKTAFYGTDNQITLNTDSAGNNSAVYMGGGISSRGVLAMYTENGDDIRFHVGTSSGTSNASVRFSNWGNVFALQVRPRDDNTTNLGASSARWSQLYAGTSTIATSDERHKENISSIDDVVLDAWGDVEWTKYQFKDSVLAKGQSARFHTGVIAQRIKTIFESHGLDAFRFGLLCYDEWDAKEAVYSDVYHPEEYDSDGNLKEAWVEKVLSEDAIEAGSIFSIRYEEALAMEAAYQRRRADRIEARLSAIESKLS